MAIPFPWVGLGGVRMWKEKVIPGWMWMCLFYLELLLFPRWSKTTLGAVQKEVVLSLWL